MPTTGIHIFKKPREKYRIAEENYNELINRKAKTKKELKSLIRKLRKCRRLLSDTIFYFEGFMDAVNCTSSVQKDYIRMEENINNWYDDVQYKIKYSENVFENTIDSPGDAINPLIKLKRIIN